MQESGFIKFLFSCAISNYLRGLVFQSTAFLISGFILDPLHGTRQSVTAVASHPILVQRDGGQHSLFYPSLFSCWCNGEEYFPWGLISEGVKFWVPTSVMSKHFPSFFV